MSTKIYIDCEFNGFGGELISMALVDERGNEFYEVLSIGDDAEDYDDWVLENVVPILGKDPISPNEFQQKLEYFLAQYGLDGFTIVADWPDDIKYFCEAVITGPGYMMGIPGFTAILDRNTTSAASKIPHNALEDARAIMLSATPPDNREV